MRDRREVADKNPRSTAWYVAHMLKRDSALLQCVRLFTNLSSVCATLCCTLFQLQLPRRLYCTTRSVQCRAFESGIGIACRYTFLSLSVQKAVELLYIVLGIWLGLYFIGCISTRMQWEQTIFVTIFAYCGRIFLQLLLQYAPPMWALCALNLLLVLTTTQQLLYFYV